MSKMTAWIEIFEALLLGPVDQDIMDALKQRNATFERSVTITLESGTTLTTTEKEVRDIIHAATGIYVPVGEQRNKEPVQTN